jgi:dihydroorotate dehydrogenase
MVLAMNNLNIRAIEVNISCPNTVEKFDPIEIIAAVLACAKHPVIVKIGISINYLRICEVFRNRIVIDAINTIPWGAVNKVPSPLYPLEGGVSDEQTAKTARYVLQDIKKRYPNIQVISGNGIFSYEEAKLRFDLGANGISFGTVYVLTPWRPEQIIRRLEG